jgi:hypothetical protein
MSFLFPYFLPLNHHTVVHHAPVVVQHAPVVVPDTLHLFATHHTPTFVSYNTEPHFTVHFSSAATEQTETETAAAAAAPKSAVEETPAPAPEPASEPAPEAPAPAPKNTVVREIVYLNMNLW